MKIQPQQLGAEQMSSQQLTDDDEIRRTHRFATFHANELNGPNSDLVRIRSRSHGSHGGGQLNDDNESLRNQIRNRSKSQGGQVSTNVQHCQVPAQDLARIQDYVQPHHRGYNTEPHQG